MFTRIVIRKRWVDRLHAARGRTAVASPTAWGLVLAAVLLATGGAAAQSPASQPADDEQLTVVRAGKAITVSGKEIDDAVIVISGGKIQNVDKGLEYPKNARVIDARHRVVMPGIINPRTRYGLPPTQRKGVHGAWSVQDEFFPAPGFFDDALRGGCTLMALVPGGDDIPGRAIVVHTAGPAAQRVVQSPSFLRVAPDKKALREGLERAKKEIEKQEKAKEEFDKKQAAQAKAPPPSQPAGSQPASQPTTQPATSQPVFEPPPIDPQLQVLVDLIQKKAGALAMLELGGAADFVLFGDVLKQFEVAHVYAMRHYLSTDFDYVIKALGEEKAKVIALPTLTYAQATVNRENLPAALSKAGCEVSLSALTDSGREFQRLPERVAELVRDGWSREEAFKALTLNPAKLLALDARFGSIEKGKDADLVFFDVDPLASGARVREVMVGGEIVYRVERDAGAAAYSSDGEEN